MHLRGDDPFHILYLSERWRRSADSTAIIAAKASITGNSNIKVQNPAETMPDVSGVGRTPSEAIACCHRDEPSRQLLLSKIEPVNWLCRCVQMKTDDSFWDRNWLKGSFVKSSNLAEQRTSGAVWVSNNSSVVLTLTHWFPWQSGKQWVAYQAPYGTTIYTQSLA